MVPVAPSPDDPSPDDPSPEDPSAGDPSAGDPSADFDALADGSAYAVLDGWQRTDVSGGDAIGWLNDLLSAELGSLEPAEARRSLLLSPTGRVRADVRAVRTTAGLTLLEPTGVADPVGTVLAPYVLSSDVSISRPRPAIVLAVPSARGADLVTEGSPSGSEVARPSLLGDGLDLIAEASTAPLAEAFLRHGLRPASAGAAEALRVDRAIPRWGTDLRAGDLPIGLVDDDAVAHAKGCYLGQEAIAKIRNLGHPPVVLRRLIADRPVGIGAALHAGGEPVGEVTSAAPARAGTVLLARVRWDARREPLALADGTVVTGARPA